jgi:hypothetical protein
MQETQGAMPSLVVTTVNRPGSLSVPAFYRYQFLHSANTTWQVFGVPPERPA